MGIKKKDPELITIFYYLVCWNKFCVIKHSQSLGTDILHTKCFTNTYFNNNLHISYTFNTY